MPYTGIQLTQEEYMQKAEQILFYFDFEKVHAYMRLVKWKWRDEFPTLQQIKETAKTLVYKSILEDHMTCGTGGFTVYKFPWGIKLSFEPFSQSSF